MSNIGTKGTHEYEGKVWDGSSWVWPENFRDPSTRSWWDRYGFAIALVVGAAVLMTILGFAAFWFGYLIG